MDCEEYVAVWRYRDHVREARAVVARQAVLDPDGPPSRTARDAPGGLFIGLGRWVLGHARTGAEDLHGSGLSNPSSGT